MSNNLDLGKRAVVLLTAVVRALGNGAADGVVGSRAGIASARVLVIVHCLGSFLCRYIFYGEVFAPPRLVSPFFGGLFRVRRNGV